MGSPADQPHVEKITSHLKDFGIAYQSRVASAHKTPRRLLKIIDEYIEKKLPMVFITVAGRSNALSGMVDANVDFPVIACPPPSDAFGGADIYSSLRMPSGVSPMLVLDPANAALAAAKILGLVNPEIQKKVTELHTANTEKLNAADQVLIELNE
jgi:5-(carboxyamino)imidazole ribonucleotide mutase/phosphoribosylaminoimidazole-succinocarboxamide synthase